MTRATRARHTPGARPANAREGAPADAPPRTPEQVGALVEARGAGAVPLLARRRGQTVAVARACVRALASLGGEAALATLEAYGDDPRLSDDLVAAWRAFDRVAFAQRVLRRAPARLGLQRLDSLAGVEQLDQLRRAYVNHCPRLTDLRPLASLANLEELRLWKLPRVTDLGPLASLVALTELHLDALPAVTDLAPLRALTRLQTLHINDATALADLAPLGTLTQLSYLVLRGLPRVTDLAPLGELPALRDLVLDEMPTGLALPARLKKRPFEVYREGGMVRVMNR